MFVSDEVKRLVASRVHAELCDFCHGDLDNCAAYGSPEAARLLAEYEASKNRQPVVAAGGSMPLAGA